MREVNINLDALHSERIIVENLAGKIALVELLANQVEQLKRELDILKGKDKSATDKDT